jgi:hypothetical protein
MVTVIVVGVLANLPSSPHRRLYAAYTVDGGQISSIKATHNTVPEPWVLGDIIAWLNVRSSPAHSSP